MSKTRLTLAAAAAAAVTAVMAAGPAQAQTSTPQPVSGTTLNTLAIGAATPAVLTNFAPGQTATSLPSLLTVVSTGSWDLEASDATNDGHLAAAAVGCTGSQPSTNNQLNVVSSDAATTVGTVNHAAGQAVTSAGGLVADGALGNTLNVAYSLDLDATEQLLTNCVYSTTVTWTVQ